MEEKKQSKIIFAVIGVAILLTLTVGLSFAIFSYNGQGGTNTIKTGTISMSFTESTNVVNLTNALPVQNDTLAQNSDKHFDFSVSSTTSSAMKVPYTLSLTELEVTEDGYTKLDPNYVQIYITEIDGNEVERVNDTAKALLGDSSTAVLFTDEHDHTIDDEETTITTYYSLRMWIPYSVDASKWTSSTNYTYKVRIDVNSEM